MAIRPHVTNGTAPLAQALRGAVMLLGSFDGMHLGHQALLVAGRTAALRHAAPLAILQCDPHPRAHFGGPSRFRISTGAAQRHLLSDAGIDLIYAPRFDAAFAAMTAERFVTDCLIAHLGVATIVAGRDFRFGAGRAGDVDLLRRLSSRRGIALTVVEDRCTCGTRISSSAVRAAISGGDLAAAAGLLGHPWLTAVDPAGRFTTDQILPPPGLWPVTACDAWGRGLAALQITLGPDGTARGPIPPGTALFSWRAPATTTTGDAYDRL